jgi:Uma2 family endonuclease
MSAGPVPTDPPPWHPDPVRQRHADFTIEDVLDLPPDAPRVELLDGVMTVVPSPSLDHQDIAGLLWAWLRRTAPPHLRASYAVGVAVGLRTTYEPDVVLYRAGASGTHHFLTQEEVVLVAEVVSPGTRRRDRITKPPGYAEAGIPHYWRVEQDPVHVYAYQLQRGHYELVADSAELLEVAEPFPIRLPVPELAQRPQP